MARIDFTRFDDTTQSGTSHVSADVLFALGLTAAAGRGGSADLVAAHMWFNLAARAGHEDGATHRRDVAEAMTKDEIAAALKVARAWIGAH